MDSLDIHRRPHPEAVRHKSDLNFTLAQQLAIQSAKRHSGEPFPRRATTQPSPLAHPIEEQLTSAHCTTRAISMILIDDFDSLGVGGYSVEKNLPRGSQHAGVGAAASSPS